MADRSLTEVEEQCERYSRQRLSAGRMAHSRGTYRKAVELYERYELSLDMCQVARVTLLHDCAREAPPEELQELLTTAEIEAVPGGANNSGLLHGLAGARLVARDLEIDDPVLLNALEHHATGCHRPSTLLTLLMCADLLEDGRSFHAAAHIPRPADHPTLDSLALAVQSCKLSRCMHERHRLVPAAVDAYHWYLERIRP